MALSPYFYDWMGMRPSRLLDQHFGLGLNPDDIFETALSPYQSLLSPYFRPWRVDTQDVGSTVHCDNDRFQVNLDVQQFTPEEIKVKVADDSVVIEGKHEEKQDQHGYVSRQFVRRYVIPKKYKLDAIQSSLSSDGVLTITAPKNEAIEAQEKVIPITQTGPHKQAIKNSKK